MEIISTDQFKQLIKEKRNEGFITPFGLVFKSFCDLHFNEMSKEYFMENASDYITDMREKCWNEFVPFEREFTTEMLSLLIDTEAVEQMNPVDAIKDFTSTYPQHIYDLSLSNTQARRSRAGKEFEGIIYLLLIGAGVPVDTQGAIGKRFFQTNQIGKLVDFVTPGVVQYSKNKRNTILISAKTTLRERWQEVPEEVSRTGIREMYLATLDESISDESLTIMNEANIIVVTTKPIKETRYPDDYRVMTFEELLQVAVETAQRWEQFEYSNEDVDTIKQNLQEQVERYNEFPYVKEHYKERLDHIR